MAYNVYRCPTPGCTRSERAARPPHWNPCPACRQPVGFYVAYTTTSPTTSPEPSPEKSFRSETTPTSTFADLAGVA